MKIVIISRAIYPSLAPRPFRATELAKYFASLGHDVTLYGVLGKFDYSSFTNETGINVKNLGKMKYATLNSDGENKITFLNRVLIRMFHRLLEFPDIELVSKTYKAIKNEKNVDLLITVAIPFPIHWGAAWAKKRLGDKFPKKWVSDCGDPYMGNSVSKKPFFYFQYIEDFWGKQTDFITIPIEDAKKAYSDKVQDKLRIIPQGFDFSNIKIDTNFKGNAIPHFAYAGIVYKGYRDPSRFLEYLSKVGKDFRFIVYTKSLAFFQQYKELLGEKLEIRNYIPREQLLFVLSQMDFLVNIENSNSVQSPSKLIDYYLSTRPVLDISSDFDNKKKKNTDDFLNGDYQRKHVIDNVQQFNIINVGKAFLDIN